MEEVLGILVHANVGMSFHSFRIPYTVYIRLTRDMQTKLHRHHLPLR